MIKAQLQDDTDIYKESVELNPFILLKVVERPRPRYTIQYPTLE